MPVFRLPHNPIITPEDVKPARPDFEVVGAFNVGVEHLAIVALLITLALTTACARPLRQASELPALHPAITPNPSPRAARRAATACTSPSYQPGKAWPAVTF